MKRLRGNHSADSRDRNEPLAKRSRNNLQYLPSSSDSDDESSIPCAQPSLSRIDSIPDLPKNDDQPSAPASHKAYLPLKLGFQESYGKLMRMTEVLKAVLESDDSSDPDSSDHSISSFEDPDPGEEPIRQVPANSFILSTEIKKPDGTVEVISFNDNRSSCQQCRNLRECPQ